MPLYRMVADRQASWTELTTSMSFVDAMRVLEVATAVSDAAYRLDERLRGDR